jgi:ABC-2 type transport system ATP-binding protein
MQSLSLPAVETHALMKSFGATRAVDGIDLVIRRGSIFGLLGPNGAGKTTMVRLLATLLRPDSGTALVLGYDTVRAPDEVRRRVSLTGQFASIDEDLSGRENLILLARLLGFSRPQARSRAEELLHAFGLEEAAQRQAKTFSGGMRRRLDIAASILRTPELLVLDEPTTGLDPRSREEVWEIIRTLVAGGTTVLLTTQYLDEADHLADRIAVIDRGRVIAEGTSTELKASVGRGVLHMRLANAADRKVAAELLSARLGEPVHLESDAAALAVQLSDPSRATEALVALDSAGIALSQFSLGQPSLDEVFFALTGHAATDGTDPRNVDPSMEIAK